MPLDYRDYITQGVCPTLPVPKFGELPAMDGNGHRFMVADDGLWIEVKRPWLHLIWPLAQQTNVAIPYGSLRRKAQFAFGKLPADLIRTFAADAAAALPNEAAAWLVWNEAGGHLDYQLLPPVSAGSGHIHFERPALAPHQSLAVDLHSHGSGAAFFSSQDNQDDAGEVKISGVIGSLSPEGDQLPSVEFRICALGLTIPVSVDPAALFALAKPVFAEEQ